MQHLLFAESFVQNTVDTELPHQLVRPSESAVNQALMNVAQECPVQMSTTRNHRAECGAEAASG